MTKLKLQALRIEAGWNSAYNQFTETDYSQMNYRENKEDTLLILCNSERGKMINLIWKSNEEDGGNFILLALNYLETFNPATNNFDLEVDWEKPYAQLKSRNKAEIIERIEQWFTNLPVTHDSRILKKRGETDEPSESYRKRLLKDGISETIVHQIMFDGNQKIQNILLDYSNHEQRLIKV